MTRNPPWADRALRRFAPGLAAAGLAPPAASAKEYGCGHYGCAFPAPGGRVLKLTSDPSEALFVAAYLTLPELARPVGLTRYEAVVALAGERFRRRQLYAILRAEARDVGALAGFWGLGAAHAEERWAAVGATRASAAEARALLAGFALHAAEARDVLARLPGDAFVAAEAALARSVQGEAWGRGREAITGDPEDRLRGLDRERRRYVYRPAFDRLRGEARAAVHLAACAHLAEVMEHDSPVTSHVGVALGAFLDRGILLADVHLGNVGRADVPGYASPVWVITDPGHAVFLARRWEGLVVPEVRA